MRKTVISIILVVALVTSALLSGCLFGVATGSGNLVIKEMDFSDFTRIEVGHAFEVEITQSSSYSVSITADDNLFEHIQVSKSGETLKIGLKSVYGYRSVTLRAKITMPELHELDLSGATHGTAQGLSSSHDFVLDLSGASSLGMVGMSAGDIELDLSGASVVTGSLSAVDAQFDLSGASQVELEGSANNMLITASGASHLELADFPVRNAGVNLSGASEAIVNLCGKLNAALSGGSQLLYIGEPILGDPNISGGSVMEKIELPSRPGG